MILKEDLKDRKNGAVLYTSTTKRIDFCDETLSLKVNFSLLKLLVKKFFPHELHQQKSVI